MNRRGAILLGLLGVASAAAAFGLSGRSGGAEAAKTTTRATTTAPLRLAPKARKSVTAGPLTLVAGGDIAFSGAGASAATFAGIRRFLNGDIVFGNLEGTLATSRHAQVLALRRRRLLHLPRRPRHRRRPSAATASRS